MTTDGADKFSAVSPLTGYLYQVRWALIEAARRLRQGADFAVEIERIDDVSFSGSDGESDQYQLKHRDPIYCLSDSAPDVWKTLRIWSTKFDVVDPGQQFYIVTTGIAPEGSAAAALRPGSRDIERAYNSLMTAATSTKNRENAAGVEAFLKLSPSERQTLVSRAHVFDRQLTLHGLQGAQHDLFYMAVERDRYESFIERVEGWWNRRIYQYLKDNNPILGEELQHKIDDVRDQLRSDSLPIDDVHDLLAEFEPANADPFQRVFVLQLELIGLKETRLLDAIRDWMRAMSQRSRWVREQLVVAGELERYETRLVEEWRFLYNEMCEELGEEAGEEEMANRAKALFRAVGQLPLPLRARCHEPSILRGSYHELAEHQRVGWHAKYQERLKSLIAPAATVA